MERPAHANPAAPSAHSVLARPTIPQKQILAAKTHQVMPISTAQNI